MPGSTDPKVLLLALEAVYGVDQVPAPATDAILIRDEVRAPALEVFYAERNNAKGYYGRDQQIPVGTKMTVGFDVEMAGSGAAGTAPKWAKAMRAAGMAEKLLAAAHASVAVAGGASTITLAAAASAVDQAYRPLRIRITSGTGSGQVRIITNYVGATKVATVTPAWTTPPDVTSNYSIDAAAAYSPVSTGHESASIYFYWGGFLHKLIGARGELGWRFPNMDIPLFSFDYEGLYGGIVDSAQPYPAIVLTGFQDPLGVNNQNTSLVSVHGHAAALYNFDGRMGNQLVYRNLPGAEDMRCNDREPSGSIEFESPTIAVKDLPSIVRAGTLGQISLLHGTVVGNRVAVDGVQAQLTNLREGEQDKTHTWQADTLFKPTGLGNDEVVISAL
jgi:hypothetical protein